MASPKKVKRTIEDVETVVENTIKKEVSNNTLNKDGFEKGSALTAEQYARYKAGLK